MFRHALLVGLLLLLSPTLAMAGEEKPLDLAYWTAAPFVVLLLLIAILPLLAEHWWHKNLHKAIVAFPIALAVAGYLVSLGDKGTHALLHVLQEYVSFIILLWGLYTIAGGIVIDGDFKGRPFNNTLLLLIGACLASFIGTTGASMLLIRPFLRMNHGRKSVAHLPVFFIFIVSNLGGLLTPLGDPPLFLGYIRGINFFWTMQNLWLEWLVVNGVVLGIFFFWELFASHGETIVRDPEIKRSFGIRGGFNFLLLGGVIGAVLSKKFLEGHPLEPYYLPEASIVLLGLISLALTPRVCREANNFTWSAIIEVAVLFIGIFVAMVPALELLRKHGPELGVTQPWQYFWLTGALSSFLDNAPTYLTFGTLAAGPEAKNFAILMDPMHRDILAAISCGAVFMGANTYIGNGPNFMVKAIAEEDGYKCPSFFGYMLYSGFILLPTFVLVTYLFFWK